MSAFTAPCPPQVSNRMEETRSNEHTDHGDDGQLRIFDDPEDTQSIRFAKHDPMLDEKQDGWFLIKHIWAASFTILFFVSAVVLDFIFKITSSDTFEFITVLGSSCALYGEGFLRYMGHYCGSVLRHHQIRWTSRQFEYTPLPESSIRVLSILPGDTSAPISCTLREELLDNATDFTAVSYVWEQLSPASFVIKYALFNLEDLVRFILRSIMGHPNLNKREVEKKLIAHHIFSGKGSCTITCNGQRLDISRNLHDFLLEMRKSGLNDEYWIDAICVNQNDLAERQQSVFLMTRIYSQAKGVIAWLGRCPLPFRNAELMGKVDLSVSENQNEDSFEQTMRQALRFCARIYVLFLPYFSRIWTIQECAIPRQLTFRIGQFEFTESQLQQMHQLLPAEIAYAMSLLGCFDMSTAVLQGRSEYQNQGPWSTARYLMAAQDHKARDDRDLIYAGQGLLADGIIIEPDYKTDTVEVFIACGRRLLLEEGLSALSFASNGSKSHISLPSWAPHLHVLGPLRPLKSQVSVDFDAGGSLESHYEITLKHQLQVVGQCKDTIAEVLSPALEMMEVVASLLARCEIYVSTQEWMFTAIARTLTADCAEVRPRPTAKLYKTLNGLAQRRMLGKKAMYNGDNEEVYKLFPAVGQRSLARHEAAGDAYETQWRQTVALLSSQLAKLDLPIDHIGLSSPSADTLVVHDDEGGNDNKNSFEDLDWSGFMKLGPQDMQKKLTELKNRIDTTFEDKVTKVRSTRSVFVTDKGYIGLGSPFVQKGDQVMILAGVQMPYLIRPVEGEETVRMVGEAYVHGLMYGEALLDNWNPSPIVIV